MRTASALAIGNYYGEPVSVRHRTKRPSLREPIRDLLYANWWTIPELAAKLQIDAPLARYYVLEIARRQLVFARKQTRQGRQWAKQYRCYPSAVNVTGR
jgi:hypothetical protein